MTKIIYWAAKKDIKETEYHGYTCGTVGLWSEIVSGGEEELKKRKKEIQAHHEEQSRFAGISKDHPAKFFDEVEVRDYQEFQI